MRYTQNTKSTRSLAGAMWARLLALLAMTAPLCACGNAATGSQQEGLLPLAVGARWEYRVADAQDGSTHIKRHWVDAATSLDGVDGEVLRVITEQEDGDRTVSLQQDTGDRVVRYEEETFKNASLRERDLYTPAKLRVPYFESVGDTLTQSFRTQTYDGSGALVDDSSRAEVWTLEAIEPLAVPAGSFDRAYRIRRVSTVSDKTFWFVPGIGKVKERGPKQVEELNSYELP